MNEVKLITGDDGKTECHVFAAEGWDDCQSLARFLTKYYGAIVISQEDRIFTREWILAVGTVQLYLRHHEDIGNYLSPDVATSEAVELLNRIADDLRARLST